MVRLELWIYTPGSQYRDSDHSPKAKPGEDVDHRHIIHKKPSEIIVKLTVTLRDCLKRAKSWRGIENHSQAETVHRCESAHWGDNFVKIDFWAFQQQSYGQFLCLGPLTLSHRDYTNGFLSALLLSDSKLFLGYVLRSELLLFLNLCQTQVKGCIHRQGSLQSFEEYRFKIIPIFSMCLS